MAHSSGYPTSNFLLVNIFIHAADRDKWSFRVLTEDQRFPIGEFQIIRTKGRMLPIHDPIRRSGFARFEQVDAQIRARRQFAQPIFHVVVDIKCFNERGDLFLPDFFLSAGEFL